MRILTIVLYAFLFASATATATFGQKKATSPETKRVFSLTDGLMGDLHSDATLTELRKGNRVESAVLDVCHDEVQGPPHKDRFVVTLMPQGDKLVGSGQSQEDNLPINVTLTRKRPADGYSFGGSITRGTTKYEIASDDNKDMSESEFSDSQPSKEEVIQTPPNFAKTKGQDDILDISPDSIGIKVKREALAGLANELKGQKVKVYVDSLTAGCDELRSGYQVVHLQVDPNRAVALVDNLKRLPGVLSAGWISSPRYAIDYAVLIQGTESTPIDRDHIASAIVAAEEKSLSATLESTRWDPQTGELTVKLKRPNQTIPQLGLTDSIQTTWLVSSQSPEAKHSLILWLGEIVVNINDNGPEPHLELLQPSLSDESEDKDYLGFPDNDELLTAVEHGAHGLIWDKKVGEWVSQRGKMDRENNED